MSDNFRWHGGDDNRWEESKETPRSTRSFTPPWQRLLLALLVLLLLGGGGYWLYRRATQQVEEATAAIKTDVRAVHDLVRRAAQQQDPELLRSVLSGRDSSWVDAQLTLAETGALFNRDALGLNWQADAASEPTITVNPELNRAELTITDTYTVLDGTEPVRLRHTLIYRRGSEHWLYAPPEEDFWGSGRKSQGKYLSLIYAGADDAWAGRLAADLDAQIAAACETLPDLNCDPDLHLTLTLHTDAEALLTLNDPLYPLQGHLSLSLPSLALAGTPVSEAAYEAVRRGYAIPLISNLIAHQVGYECCEEAAAFQALLDYQLAQLGLRPWPVTARQQQQVFLLQPSLGQPMILWSDNGLDRLNSSSGQQLYALVDFLTSSAATGRFGVTLSAASLQRNLKDADSHLEWLWRSFSPYLEEGLSAQVQDVLSARWYEYAFTQSVTSQGPPPSPLPHSEAFLFCVEAEDSPLGSTTTLYRYHTETEESKLLTTFTNSVFSLPLDTPGTALHNGFDRVGDRWLLSLWRDGEETAVLSDRQFVLSFGQTDPTGTFLTVYAAVGSFSDMQIQLIPLDDCLNGACETRSIAGIPFWSPSGDHTLLLSPEGLNSPFSSHLQINGRFFLVDSPPLSEGNPPDDTALYRADSRATEDSLISIGYGYAPFWIDDERYGYVRIQDGAATLVTASVQDDTPQPLFGLDRLTEDLPTSLRYQIGYAAVNPTDPDSWIIAVFDNRNQVHLFHYDRATDILTQRLKTNYRQVHVLTFSPNGRWLLVLGQEATTRAQASEAITYYLHNLRENETTTYYGGQEPQFFFDTGLGFSWIDGGDWLLFPLRENLLGFLAPEEGYLHVMKHDRGNCIPAIW